MNSLARSPSPSFHLVPLSVFSTQQRDSVSMLDRPAPALFRACPWLLPHAVKTKVFIVAHKTLHNRPHLPIQ